MKDQKNQILEALSTKHIETIKTAKLSNINGGSTDGGCIITIIPELL